MPKCWSLSTTVRNPERNIPFLKVLYEFEGLEFNEDIQSKFFKRLIQTKNYQPTGLSDYFKEKFNDSNEFSDQELEEILNSVHYKNKSLNDNQEKIYALRGRTAVGNLNKMGIAIAKQNTPIKIFDLGKKMLEDSVDFQNIMFKYFLKWQLNNPIEDGFNDFDIIPFIATLHVINKVNTICMQHNKKAKGLSRDEFAFFIPTLTDYRNIDNIVNNIIDFRNTIESLSKTDKKNYIDNFADQLVINTFKIDPSQTADIEKWINNLYDYGDSIRRYFRQTGLVYYRGNGYYTDLSPSRLVEIESILETFSGSSQVFNNADDYIQYLGDIKLPALPWENVKTLNEIYADLINQAIDLQQKIQNQFPGQSLHIYDFKLKSFDNYEKVTLEISNLRNCINTLKYDLSILEERNLHNLASYIENLNTLATRKRDTSGQDPLLLEQYSALSLMALDDAQEIHPNYTLGDDNIPTFTARRNVPDIECYYETFNMICEVTLKNTTTQWYSEGQPVMRHFRDFEEKSKKENYCLFLAPSIHRDTKNEFWGSIKYGYEGAKQKIIPLSIFQYNNILRIVLDLNNKQYRVKHKDIKKLLDKIYNYSLEISNSTDWISAFDQIILRWKNEMFSNI